MGKFQDKIEYLITAKVDNAIKNIKKVENQTKKAQKASGGFFKSMKAGYLAIGVAIAAVGGIMIKAIKAFAEQEKAEKLLNKAFSQTADNADELTEKFKKFAAEQQKVTRFGDEVTIMAAAQLQALAGLTGEGLETALKATMDLSVAQGIDLKTAALLVGKSVSSSTNALSRYGIEMKKGGTKTERLADLTDTLAKKFGGFAEAEGKTAAGMMARFSNNVGDLWEVLGAKLMPTLSKVITAITNLITPERDLATATDDLVKHTAEYEEIIVKLNSATLDANSNEARLLKTRKAQLGLDISKDIDKINASWEKNNVTEGISLSIVDQLIIKRDRLNVTFRELTDNIDENDKSVKNLGGSLRSGGGQILTYAERITQAREANTEFQEAAIDVTNALSKQKSDLDKVTGAYIDSKDQTQFLKLLTDNLKVSVLANVDALIKEREALEAVNKEKSKAVPKGPKDKREVIEGRDVTAFDQAIKDQIAKEKDRIDTIKELEDKAAQDEIDIQKAKWNAIAQMAQASFNFIGNLIKASSERELAKMAADTELALASLGSRQALDAITQEEKLEQIAELEEARDKALEHGDEQAIKETQRELDKVVLAEQLANDELAIRKKQAAEEKKIKKKVAISDKIFAVFGATLDFARAIASAFASVPGGPVTKTIAARVTAGLAGINLAGVIATPIPAFKHGGEFTTNGPELFLAGDNATGVENIKITPVNEGDGGGGGNIYNFYGINNISDARNELMRLEGIDAWQ